jgi:hypothetical protein
MESANSVISACLNNSSQQNESTALHEGLND